MATDSHPKPSFSPYRKWSIGFHVTLIILVVLAVVVMVNYLSRDYFLRWHWSTASKIQLHPRTIKLLDSLTNQVKVTIYYTKEDPLYSTVVAWLNEYQLRNPKITVRTVDYLLDAGAAQKAKTDYKLSSASDKNLVIFDCEGRIKTVDGKALADYTLEQVENADEPLFNRKPLAFNGETMFTSVLLAVTSPKPLNAYFLQGHGEHQIDSAERLGYTNFSLVLKQNYITNAPLSLLGPNSVPADCDLLIIAGPKAALLTNELDKIERYLNQGGRLLALFNADSVHMETGLEKILARWGIEVGTFIIKDPEHAPSEVSESDLVVSAFSRHQLVNPLLGSGLYLVRPRPIRELSLSPPAADAPRVEEIAFSGPRAFADADPHRKPHQFPLMVALEKSAIKGVITERGAARIVVAGDSLFLANHYIDLVANRDFAGYAVNWLLDRPQLLEGIGSRPIARYKLTMTQSQLRATGWLLLAGMPGAVLVLGALVWLRRRR